MRSIWRLIPSFVIGSLICILALAIASDRTTLVTSAHNGYQGVAVEALPDASGQGLVDDFSTFDTSKWTTAPYVGFGGITYTGLPETLAPITLDGKNMLRMTSIMTDFQRQGIGSVQTFNASAGTLTVDFKTMPYHDTSVPAANQYNIDGLLGVFLWNPSDNRYFGMEVFASHTGDPSYRYISLLNSAGGDVFTPIGWQYETYYRFVMTSNGTTTRLSFQNSAGAEILGQTFNRSFGDLGSYKIALEQGMGIPHAEFYSDAAIDKLVFSAAESCTPPELIVNGGFENEPNFGSGVSSDAGFSALTGSQIPGWTIMPGHAVAIHNTALYPYISGNYSVNTDGEGYNGGNADFYQDFVTTAGTSYNFSFDWRGWMNNAPNTRLQVSIQDLTTLSLLFDQTYAFDSMLHHESATIVGTGNSMRLRIRENPESGTNDNQFIVDNFSFAEPCSCIAPPAGMVAWWPGDGNSNDIQNGNHGTMQGGATFAAGKVDQAFSFNGTNGYVSTPDSPNWDFGTGDFSLDGWINTASPNTTQRLVSAGSRADGADNLWTLGFGANPAWGSGNRLNFAFWTGSSYVDLNSNQVTIGTNTWHHIAVVRSGSTMTFYLDGLSAGSSTLGSLPINGGSTGAIIGARYDANAANIIEFANGLVDEVEIFNHALSASENAPSTTPVAQESVKLASVLSARRSINVTRRARAIRRRGRARIR